MLRNLLARLFAIALAGTAGAALLLPSACSRRDLNPTGTPSPIRTLTPGGGTPAPLKVTVTYTLSTVLSTYPVAVWVEASDGAYVAPLRAYSGSFQWSPSYVLPTWWGKDQGRDSPVGTGPRVSGTYAETWDFTDWTGAPASPGQFRFRIETSNWGTRDTDEVDEVDAPVFVSSVGQHFTNSSGTYVSALSADVHL